MILMKVDEICGQKVDKTHGFQEMCGWNWVLDKWGQTWAKSTLRLFAN